MTTKCQFVIYYLYAKHPTCAVTSEMEKPCFTCICLF